MTITEKYRSRFHCRGTSGQIGIFSQLPFKEKGQLCYQKGSGPVVCVQGGIRGELEAIPGLPLPGGQCADKAYVITHTHVDRAMDFKAWNDVGDGGTFTITTQFLGKLIAFEFSPHNNPKPQIYRIRYQRSNGQLFQQTLGTVINFNYYWIQSIHLNSITRADGTSQVNDIAQCGSNLEKCRIRVYDENDAVLEEVTVNGSCADVTFTHEPGECTFYTDKSRITKQGGYYYVKNESSWYDVTDYVDGEGKLCSAVYYMNPYISTKPVPGQRPNNHAPAQLIRRVCSPKGCNKRPHIFVDCGGGSKPPYEPPAEKPEEKCPPGTYCEMVENGYILCCDQCGNLLKKFKK